MLVSSLNKNRKLCGLEFENRIPVSLFVVVFNMLIALIHVEYLVLELILQQESKGNQYSKPL